MLEGMGGAWVREARLRAGLTQAELARRTATTQSAVARLESGRTRPAYDTVVEMIRACGLDLLIEIAERDDSDWEQAEQLLRRSPGRRVQLNSDGVRSADAFERAGVASRA